jgi:hypothetical protein
VDPLSAAIGASAAGAASHTDKSVSWAVCVVEDAFAHAGVYILRLPGGPLIHATELLHCSGVPLGSRPVGGYAPRSQVLIAYHPAWDPPAVILGAVPKSAGDARMIMPDSQVLRSRAGQFEDPLHYGPFAKSPIFGNHSAGRPADTLPGDWGSINDLGVGVWFGRLLASLRASDLAKIEAFWGDDLLRIVGYNMELFTAGSQEFRLNDEGEYNEVWRATPWPWEGLGVRSASESATTAKEGRLKPGAEEAPLEPSKADQLLIPRHIRMRGYLGDCEKEFICAPPQSLSTETYAAKTKYLGLLEISKAHDGAYSVRSAKEVTLEKYALLPIPKELFAPEDPLGDHRTNYKAADQFGTGDAYKLPEFVWGADDAQVRPAQLLDYHAWRFGRYEKGGLGAHVKDWYLPEEEEISEPVPSALYDKSLKIGHTFMAALPSFGEIVIDHRPDHKARYYRSRSMVKLHDDGSVSLEDGYGSQILLKGGSIFFTCVGDVWAQPGRNFVAWAPHDAILRAGNSADVSAAKGDVRLKAEKNLHVLSGNSGTGGTLLENRATGAPTSKDYEKTGQGVNSRGVVIKASGSAFHVIADDIHIGRGQSKTGRLVLDAGKQGSMFLRAQNIRTRTTSLLSMVQASDTGPDEEMIALNKGLTVISTPLKIGGQTIIAPSKEGNTADLIVGGRIVGHGQAVFGGNVASNGGFSARSGAPFVGKLERDIALDPDAKTLGNQIREETEAVGEITQTENKRTVDSTSTSAGNETFQSRIGFSCRRTKEDLKLDDTFKLYEARWQQILRLAGVTGGWDEPEVKAPTGDVTRPHPGQDGWSGFQAYATVDLSNFDVANGQSKNRATLTEKGAKPKLVTLKDGYLINAQA